ncbi:hypothetical protein AB0J63_14095 [Streptosporangium canum]|uniref:hypothetical protein n=1 Tax=Streptosporangium canum TaxID=324952 RepID=UPI0034485733
MNVTLVLVGVDIPSSGLPAEGRRDPASGQWVMLPFHRDFHRDRNARGLEATQTERRFDLIELDRFRYDTPDQMKAWTKHLAGMEEHLRLLKSLPGMRSDGTMPEYLYHRANGVVGLLERLIEDGCAEAVETGHEVLTEHLLDTIATAVDGAPGRWRNP